MNEVVQEVENSAVDENGFSKMLYWEVWNFMSVEHAKVDFDDCGIVNFKGYNDSGKSSMLRALDVLLFNVKPNMQTAFIQDDKDYFRVMAVFTDGVAVLRDKYINGQSLYEMYKNGECIFTTKKGKLLTKVAKVPDCIEKYLGLVQYDGIALNSRSCFDKQLLVQTTGSENYKFLNSTLKSEEIAVAGDMVNTDKNRVLSDINALDVELNIYKEQTKNADGVTGEMVVAFKDLDQNIDLNMDRLSSLAKCDELHENVKSVPVIPEVAVIGTQRLSLLGGILQSLNELISIPAVPEMSGIDSDRVVMLDKLVSAVATLKSITVAPEFAVIDKTRIEDLMGILRSYSILSDKIKEIEGYDDQLTVMNAQCVELEKIMSDFGQKYVRCKNCGALVETGSHSH